MTPPVRLWVRTRPATIGVLDELCQMAAQEMLAVALLAERRAYLEAHASELDATGKRLVVGNGFARTREVTTGAGMVEASVPWVDDRREGEHFSSAILPAYMRKSPKVTEVLPILYLRGFLPATSLPRSVSSSAPRPGCRPQHGQPAHRGLPGRARRVEREGSLRRRLRLLLGRWGALQHPPRRGPPVLPGHRGCASRRHQRAGGAGRRLSRVHRVLGRGAPLAQGPGVPAPTPVLAVGDGALGFWAAMRNIFPETREQRCWVHATANCLDALSKRLHGDAKDAIAKIYSASSHAAALEAIKAFSDEFSAFPKAVKKITGQLDVLLAFYDFPLEHWIHLRTTNPIESTFSTVSLRTKVTRGAGLRKAALAMAYKLLDAAQDRWRRINGHELVPLVRAGATFIDGKLQERSVTTPTATAHRVRRRLIEKPHPQLLTMTLVTSLTWPRNQRHGGTPSRQRTGTPSDLLGVGTSLLSLLRRGRSLEQ